MTNIFTDQEDLVIYKNKENNYELVFMPYNGGSFHVRKNKELLFNDCGWELKDRNIFFTSYWYSRNWKKNIFKEKNIITCEGNLFKIKKYKNSLVKHMILRFLSIIGINLIQYLKEFLIFSSRDNKFYYKRCINLHNQSIVVKDTISGILKPSNVHRCNQLSKRHTASGQIFDLNNYMENKNFQRIETRSFDKNILTIKTEYNFDCDFES